MANFCSFQGTPFMLGGCALTCSITTIDYIFYIIVSKDPHVLSRKEDQFFENMNTYLDEESSEKKEIFLSHYNCLAEFLFT
jgi:hypothetical protein